MEGTKDLLQNTIAVLELKGPQLPNFRTQLYWYSEPKYGEKPAHTP